MKSRFPVKNKIFNNISKIVIFLSPLLILTASSNERKKPKPNIIFIICDDLNDAVAGYDGHSQTITPNIERLVENGVRFMNAQVNSPVCGPSRASLLSGLYPHTTGYFGYNFNKFHWRFNPTLKNSVTFPEYFRKYGYTVLGTGKVHHNSQEEWDVWDDFGAKPSWGPWPWDGTSDTVYSFGQLNPWANSAIHQDFADTFEVGDQFGALENIPKIPADLEKGIPGYEGWRLYHKPFRFVNDDDRDLMPDELNAQWAVKKLSERHEKPFLMCIGMNRPHEPMFAPQKYFDMFPLENIELAPVLENDLEDCSNALTRQPYQVGQYGHIRYQFFKDVGGELLMKKWTQAYLANIAFLDVQIGKILDALVKSRYTDNTYIFFVSDNGYHMGEKLYLFKNSVWEESCRTPFIVAGPGVKKGAVCDQPISLVDLYPTFMDLCDLKDEPNRMTNQQALDGHSIKDLLYDPEKGQWEGSDPALTAVASRDRLGPDEPGKVERQHYSLRTRQYRYVYCNTGEEELYDHQQDPYEWNNLAGDSNYTKIKKDMYNQLVNMLDLKK
jgi:arylsulfatase A-like enzyme